MSNHEGAVSQTKNVWATQPCEQQGREGLESAPVVPGGHNRGVVLVVKGGAAKVNNFDVA